MAEKYYTVEQISQMLTIHPKTIQRYVREGKLRASKVGKSWRITGHDLSLFLESDAAPAAAKAQERPLPLTERIKASAVVDIAVYDKEEAMHLTDILAGALNSKPPEYGDSSMYTQYIPQENMVRVTLWGGIRTMEMIFSAIAMLSEQTDE